MKQWVKNNAGSRCEDCEGMAKCDVRLHTQSHTHTHTVTFRIYSRIFIPLFDEDGDRTTVLHSEFLRAGQPGKGLEARSVEHSTGNRTAVIEGTGLCECGKEEWPGLANKPSTLATRLKNTATRSRNRRDVVRGILLLLSSSHHHHHGGKTENYTALKVPRQCPLVLLVKVGCKQGKVLASEEGSILGARTTQKTLKPLGRFFVLRAVLIRYFNHLGRAASWRKCYLYLH
jgi:hypothetical protein